MDGRVMARYIKSPRSAGWVEDDHYNAEAAGFAPPLHVADHLAIDTGLVWPDGKPIMRTPNPIGFGRDFEW